MEKNQFAYFLPPSVQQIDINNLFHGTSAVL
jgi:hypothetical protein